MPSSVLARSVERLGQSVRAEAASALPPADVISFPLARLKKGVDNAIAHMDAITSHCVEHIHSIRGMREGKEWYDPADGDDRDEIIMAGDTQSAIADAVETLNTIKFGLSAALMKSGQETNWSSAGDGRFVRRLAARADESEKRLARAQSRVLEELHLISAFLDGRVSELRQYISENHNVDAAYSAKPLATDIDYAALRKSIARRFRATLDRLAQ